LVIVCSPYVCWSNALVVRFGTSRYITIYRKLTRCNVIFPCCSARRLSRGPDLRKGLTVGIGPTRAWRPCLHAKVDG
jgi:hypothetical protein